MGSSDRALRHGRSSKTRGCLSKKEEFAQFACCDTKLNAESIASWKGNLIRRLSRRHSWTRCTTRTCTPQEGRQAGSSGKIVLLKVQAFEVSLRWSLAEGCIGISLDSDPYNGSLQREQFLLRAPLSTLRRTLGPRSHVPPHFLIQSPSVPLAEQSVAVRIPVESPTGPCRSLSSSSMTRVHLF